MTDICNIHVMKPLLESYGFRFSKAKGQNFLTAAWVPAEIANASGINTQCGVLEIGPGIGSLTQQLCLRAGKVCAVEVDCRLEPILRETCGEFSNLELIWADAMKLNLKSLVNEKFRGLRPMACANLPYYITTPVLTTLLEADSFTRVTVMVQKEVAQRISAAPGTSNYGAFSVFCQYHAVPRLLFDVGPQCFLPRPSVTSAVVTLDVRSTKPWNIQNKTVFFQTVRASFAMRRKKLVNGLTAGFPTLEKDAIAEIIAQCGLDASVRGETLGIPEFASLANAIAASCKEKT